MEEMLPDLIAAPEAMRGMWTNLYQWSHTFHLIADYATHDHVNGGGIGGRIMLKLFPGWLLERLLGTSSKAALARKVKA